MQAIPQPSFSGRTAFSWELCRHHSTSLSGHQIKWAMQHFKPGSRLSTAAKKHNRLLQHQSWPAVSLSYNIYTRQGWDLYYTPFTQGLRPLCLPCATTKLARSPMKAEGRQNGCLGRSRVVHRTFRHRHGRHGRREVLSMFKTVAQRSPRRSVAHRSLKGGRMKAHTSPWSQNGCTVVVHWSSS